jgi:hypothetical protein
MWFRNVEVFGTFASSSNDEKRLESVAAYTHKENKTRFYWRVTSHGKVIKRTGSFRAAVAAYNAAS